MRSRSIDTGILAENDRPAGGYHYGMHTADHARLMARYNKWMNQKVYAASATLSDEERKRDRHAFFRSIHGTLNHLMYGDLAWLGRFVDGAPRATSPATVLYDDFDALSAARVKLDEEILTWTAGLSPTWLAAPFGYRSAIDGQEREFPAWVLVTHMFNHQTHHRGQLTTLLTQCGLDVGSTDLPFMPAG